MKISRVGDPAQKGPRAPFIRRPAPGMIYTGIVLAKTVFACYTHFVLTNRCTMPCLAVRAEDGKIIECTACAWCEKEMPERWKGYLHCWSHQHERDEFLELTWPCWRAVKACYAVMPDLRGYELTANRGKGATSRLWVKLDHPRPSTELRHLPAEKTPEQALALTMHL